MQVSLLVVGQWAFILKKNWQPTAKDWPFDDFLCLNNGSWSAVGGSGGLGRAMRGNLDMMRAASLTADLKRTAAAVADKSYGPYSLWWMCSGGIGFEGGGKRGAEMQALFWTFLVHFMLNS